MGKQKTTSSTTNVINQTTTPEATPEERQLNQLELERIRATQPGQIALQQQGMDLTSALLSGQIPQGGFYSDIAKGVDTGLQMGQPAPLDPSRYQIGEDVTSSIVQKSLRDLYPQFQKSGILDSGVAAEISGRTAGDIRRNVAERNLDVAQSVDEANLLRSMGVEEFNIGTQRSGEAFNIGNLFNLMNLALTGQAQVQQPLLSQSSILSGRLAGLRSTTTAGTTTSSLAQTNPFLTGGDIMSGIGTGVGIWGALK